MKFLNLILASIVSITQANEGNYIISFKKEQRSTFDSHVASITDLFISRSANNNTILHKYEHILTGVAARLDDATLAKVKILPNVARVEEDGIAKISAIQYGAPWGLARVSHRNTLDSTNKDQYVYNPDAGLGTTVYVLDTGINTNHIEFGGRATWGANFIQGSSSVDDHGHGTHCAGTVGSNAYGVAKKAKLVAVKVLDSNGSGPWSSIIAGFNWVVQNAKGTKNIISISIGGDKNASVDQALTDTYAAGIFVAVAAMNENRDACLVSPASAVNSFTVGATDINDQKASFSNWGTCVDILAPGVDVLSTGITSNTATKVMSGTSMATPHVAGLAATLLSQGVTFPNLRSTLQNLSTYQTINGFSANTPNLLANNGYNN
jgi:cerevisin